MALAHALPAVTSVSPVRRVLFSGLNGIGRPEHIALSFDDGPDPESTPAFLDALDDLGWRATFFMLGAMVRRAPSLAREVVGAGHEVALHGDIHVSHLLRRPSEVREDLESGLTTIVDATGARPRWFRPPYGALATSTVLFCSKLSLQTVLWTTWGREWTGRATAAGVAADVESGMRPGATVLLHDSDCTSAPGSWRSALDALPLIAEHLRGFEVGTISEHGIGRDGPACAHPTTLRGRVPPRPCT